ncbi:MAG: hypothetical protein JRI50_11710 [Deltaproteobacteria bacterium]|nr:hypothetical protein [Deltaproteobacteria bacterium]
MNVAKSYPRLSRLKPRNPSHLKHAHLIAIDSPRQAFYLIWIELYQGAFRVCKASGAHGRIWHRQAWEFHSLAEAEALFEKRLRDKTNQERRSPRKYRLASLLPRARYMNEPTKKNSIR